MQRFGYITGAWLAPLALLAAAQVHGAAVAELAWLSGCWASEGAESGSGEIWTQPAGETLLGISRTVRNGKTVAHEFMQIRALESGQLAFIARPSGQAEATFPLLRAGPRELVFENPTHNFPQRVIYRLTARDRLLGRIEGTRNGELKAAEFPMRRVSCP